MRYDLKVKTTLRGLGVKHVISIQCAMVLVVKITDGYWRTVGVMHINVNSWRD